MASRTQRIVLMKIFIFFLIGLGSTLRMDVTPKSFSKLLHERLNISCVVDGNSFAYEDVIGIQIERPDGKPIANVDAKHGLVMGRKIKSNVQAEGLIDNKDSRSYLMLTITNPEADDIGLYECSIFYTDEVSQFQQANVYVNVTMYNEDISSVVKFLLEKVKDLEEADRDAKTGVTDLLDTVAKMNDTIHKQKDIIKQQRDEFIELGESARQHKENDTRFQCAFSMGYNRKNKIQPGDKMLFTRKIVNLGDRYNTTTGEFTAPRDGIYVFHLAVMTVHGNDLIWISLRVNGEREVAHLVAQDDRYSDQSSISTVVSLSTGDRVFPYVINIREANYAINGYESVFSGFLLQTL